ncbi:Beige 1 [Lecanosticta acicola]|uniref:Beige 1 n=1 Tax=Lecanosticta acicola TaxID=111012 RepID=A0AAI8Z271_9PEZI|nr:Beige 1 [Lecanosticta acicola]
MALRVGRLGRLRSSSRGLNTDEQATDTAALIRLLFCHSATSDADELRRLSENAEKLRLHLGSHTASKDTFRHGGAFERILDLLTTLTSRQDLAHDDASFASSTHMISRLLALLSEALRHHRGNERYFRNHLDGWSSLHRASGALQEHISRNPKREAVAQHVAVLYDVFLAFALGLDECRYFHGLLQNEQSGNAADGVQKAPVLRNATIRHPEICADVIGLALQFAPESATAENESLLFLSSRVFNAFTDLVKANIRNNVALRQTSALSGILRSALDTTAPETWNTELQRLGLCLAEHGLNDIEDAAFLFKRATKSGPAREVLLSLLQSSKEPSLIQFDLQPHGFSSIEIMRLPGLFPPSVGYTFAAWMRIDEYDAKAHTTLFGAYDANHTCFLLMYLEKDSHQLILQTSVRAPNPSVRFKTTSFEAGKWYHVAVTQRKNPSDPSQSVASLLVDGIFAEQRRCNYLDMPEEQPLAGNSHPNAQGQRHLMPVQAFLGTPRSVALKPVPNYSTSRWSLGSAHLFSVPVSDDFVTVHYRLGLRYRGNLQDCLGPLLTYRSSAELNKYNETLHPDKSDRSDILAATEGRGSEVVAESRILLSISPAAVVDLDACFGRSGGVEYELGSKALSRFLKLAQTTRAVAVNTAAGSLNDAISHSYGAGVFTGDPLVLLQQPLDEASWCLAGSLPVLVRLLESANTKTAFLQATKIFISCVKDNWRTSEAMEKGHGFGVLAMIIREKLGFDVGSSHPSTRRSSAMLNLEDRQSLPKELLELILEFVGYDMDRPEESLLVNPMAYRVLLIDFDTWRRSDVETQRLYYAQFSHLVAGNKNSSFNQKRLTRMRIVKKLIDALKSEEMGAEAANLMMGALKALLDTNSAQTFYRDLAMFVAYGLHDGRAMPTTSVRNMASTVSLRQKIGSWARGARGSRPNTPVGTQGQQAEPCISRFELAVLVLRVLAEALTNDHSTTAIRRFNKAVNQRWLLHLLAENDSRVVEFTLSILCKALATLGAEFKTPFVEKHGGFITLKSRLKPFSRSKSVWTLCFAIFFGRNVPVASLVKDFSAFNLVEMLVVNETLAVNNPEMLPTLFGMLESGVRKVAKDDERNGEDNAVLENVIQFLGEIYRRSSAFRDFAVNSRYLQELLFMLFPLLTGCDRVSPDTELQSEALSFKGEEVKMRPHSNSLGERPPSVRSLTVEGDKRTPSPMAPNRLQGPRRISSFVLVNDNGERSKAPPAQFNAPMAPKATEPVKINVTNSLVESLLELAVTLFIDQTCYRDKFSGIGVFLKVPPGFREHQAYFESYVLVNALSQLGSHLRLNQQLLVETRVLTNLARYAQHMAEAVSEGWFIDGAQPLLDFTGEILEHLQQPSIASVKSVRLCSQSTNSIRVVFLKATLWRLAALDEDADEKDVGNFLLKMTYWQTILFSAENQETLFTKLICFLLYHKLVSGVKSVRLAAAQLWRIVLVQKPTETATMLTNTMGPDQRHLSTGFMKLVSMDDDDFLAWVDQNRDTLDTVFNNSLSKPWDDFVQNENKSSDETAKNRLSKRRDKLRQWHAEELTADDFMNRYEVSTSHWRANVHAQERLKLQRAVQDHQENINHLYTAFSKIEKLLHEPCGLEPSSGPPRWHLDETEAANRMRMRIVPDSSGLKESFQPKRKASRSVSGNNELALNAQIPRVVSDGMACPLPSTPGTSTPAATDGAHENDENKRARSDSVSGSQLLEGAFEMVDDPKEDEDGMIEDKNRKVLTSLQRGDMVQQLYNTSRIVGLEACEGLLVVGQKCIYMQDNFFQRSDGEIVSVAQAPEDERDPYVQLISGKDLGTARTKHSIGDQETRHWTWQEVLSVSKRRFLLRDVSIEVFFTDGRSYLLTCMSSKIRDDLYSAIVQRAPHVHGNVGVASEDAWRLDTLRNPEEAPKNIGAKFGNLFNQGPSNTATKKWQRGEMSNFQYLMLINTMAGRTFNDLTQYPVFPWVLADYSSEELDLDDPKSFRDFSRPMGCQTPAREAEYKDRYKQFAEMGDGNAPPFHYGTHYSSAMIVTSYLIRLQPFVQSYLLLQGGAFDHADRLFDSIEKAWLSASRDTMSDVRELTPEFFYLPEFLTNINKYDFGTKQVTGEAVNDVHLPKWAKGDPHIFIAKHREALESKYVSERLHDWIDLVFGFKQRGEMAVEATNVFQHLSYGGAKDLDKIDDQVERLATIGIIHSFGQTPHQVFLKPHVYREQQAEQKLDTLVETLTRLPDTAIHIGEKVTDFTYSPTKNQLLASGPGKLNVLPDCDRYMQWGFPDHSIRFFSKHTKRLLGLYENTHIGPVSTATFVDSKTLVTAGQDCTIGVWKVITSRDSIEIQPKTYLFGHRTAVTVLAASRVFSTLVSASADGQVLIWGLNRQNCTRVLLPPGGEPIQAARISNVSGHILLCRGKDLLLYTLNGHLLVSQRLDDEILCTAFYEGSGGNEYLERELVFTGHAGGVVNVFSLVILRDGKWELVLVKKLVNLHSSGTRSACSITGILPMSKGVYTGDEEGGVWSWECVVRGGGKR